MEKEIIIGIAVIIIAFIIYKKRKKSDTWDVFERRDKTNNKALYRFGVNRKTGERRKIK